MLVLSRKKNERLVIAGNITICVVEIRGDKVRLGVEAPPDVRIDRQEIHEKRVSEVPIVPSVITATTDVTAEPAA